MSQYIKSVQQATVTHTGTGGGATAALSPTVDTTKSIIIYNGLRSSGGSSTVQFNNIGRWSFDNGSTIRFTKDAGAANNTVAKAYVVEFNSDIATLQHGVVTITAGASSNTDAISPAVGTLNNAFVIWNGIEPTAGAGGYTDSFGVAVELTNTATVTARLGATLASNITVGYTVVEFTSNIIVAAQPIVKTTTSNQVTDTSTISSVTAGNSLIFPNGFTVATSATSPSNYSYYSFLTNGTTVTWTRTGTGTGSRSLYATVVEFQSAALSGSVQRDSISGTGSGSTNTDTLSPNVDTTMSWVQWTGNVLSANIPSVSCAYLTLSTTTVTATVNGTFNSGSTTGWEVIQFDNTAAGGLAANPLAGGGAAAVPLWGYLN